jgi:hypothetical protein
MSLNFSADSQIKTLIDSIDLNPVIKRMVKINHWTQQEAVLSAGQYKNFLFLRKKYGNEYHGENGEISQQELESLFENETQRLHFQEFGDYLYEVRKGAVRAKLSGFLKSLKDQTKKFGFIKNNFLRKRFSLF